MGGAPAASPGGAAMAVVVDMTGICSSLLSTFMTLAGVGFRLKENSNFFLLLCVALP